MKHLSVLLATLFAGCLVLFLTTAAHAAEPSPQPLKAFPGAEGFGAGTPGGRGGQTLFVTNLDDYRPGVEPPIAGSFRAALDTEGPRMVLFRVGGTISLKQDLWIRKPFLTLAGQSAPGGGICIKDYQVVLATHDLVLRHLRFRSGDLTRVEQMSVGIFGGNNSIIDHCSMTWATDEVMSSFGTVHNLTVQWSIIAEGLSRSFHPKGEHSKGSIIGGDGGITIHHCVYAHNASRNPRVNTVVLDFRNNVVYDWGYRCAYTRNGPCYVNYISNYFQPGLCTTKGATTRLFDPGDDMPRIFLADNVLAGHPEETRDNARMLRPPKTSAVEDPLSLMVVKEPFRVPPVQTDTAEIARDRVLAEAGATLPERDAADARLMDDIRNGTGRIIDSQQQVGGWPNLSNAPAPADTDHDGMPDAWEKEYGLSAGDASDAQADGDADGYLNLEEFLNGTDPNTTEPDRWTPPDFVEIQQAAGALAAQGAAEQVQREQENTRRKEAAKAETIKSLRVEISPSAGPDAPRLTVNLDGQAALEMVLVPAGSFLMGSPETEGGEENERPQHRVHLSRPFYMAATPTTTAQFCAVFGSEARPLTPDTANLPAKETTWFEASEFCEILSAVTGHVFRLPTEAEWEYACRAGTATAFNTGDMITSDQANFNGEEASPFNPVGVFRGKITPVKMFPPNAWGLYDMHGNEAEYCQDRCFRVYGAEEVTDPVGPAEGGARVLRGGKSGSKVPYIRSAYRYGYVPGVGYGFRAVMESSPAVNP